MKARTAFLSGAASVLVLLAAAGLFAVYGGRVEVSALESHAGPVAGLLETARSRAVHARLDGVAVPPLDDPALARRGLRLYRHHCADCHGAPGRPLAAFAQGLNPAPPELVYHDFAGAHEAAEAYWVIANGIRMTGMPGFGLALDDEEIWSLVAFLRTLPGLSAEEYARSFDRGVGSGGPMDPDS